MEDKKEELEESGRGSRRGGLIFTLRMMYHEGGAPSSTRDLVTRPKAGLPVSNHNAMLIELKL